MWAYGVAGFLFIAFWAIVVWEERKHRIPGSTVIVHYTNGEDVVLDAIPPPTPHSEMQLGDDVKEMYPEQWAQDAILQAWRTGKPVVGKRPLDDA